VVERGRDEHKEVHQTTLKRREELKEKGPQEWNSTVQQGKGRNWGKKEFVRSSNELSFRTVGLKTPDGGFEQIREGQEKKGKKPIGKKRLLHLLCIEKY